MHPRPSQCSLPSKHRSQPSPWVCGNEISRGFQGSLPRAFSADEPLLRLPLSRSWKIVSVFLFAFLIYRSVSGLSSSHSLHRFIPFLFFSLLLFYSLFLFFSLFPLLFPFFSYFFLFMPGYTRSSALKRSVVSRAHAHPASRSKPFPRRIHSQQNGALATYPPL